MQTADWAPLAQIIMGWAIQWVRGPKHIPNWVAYTLLACGTIVLYAWATPGLDEVVRTGDYGTHWRAIVGGAVSFFLAARGAGATSKDAKAAPGSNTL